MTVSSNMGWAMKTAVLILFLAAATARADSTNDTIRIAGKDLTHAQVGQLVEAYAKQTRMQFEFAGAQIYCWPASNGPVVASVLGVQTNGAYFHATVDAKGRVRAKELTPQDVVLIRSLLAKKSTNAIHEVSTDSAGRVMATTVLDEKNEAHLFELERVGNKWKILDVGTLTEVPLTRPGQEILAIPKPGMQFVTPRRLLPGQYALEPTGTRSPTS